MITTNAPKPVDLDFIRQHSELLPICEIAKQRKLRYSQVKYHIKKLGRKGIRVRADAKPRTPQPAKKNYFNLAEFSTHYTY